MVIPTPAPPYTHDAMLRPTSPTAHVTPTAAHARDLLVVVGGTLAGSVARCGEFLPRTSPQPLPQVAHERRCSGCWSDGAR